MSDIKKLNVRDEDFAIVTASSVNCNNTTVTYQKLYEGEKEKSEVLEKELEEMKSKLANMTENALTMFNERTENTELITSLRNENMEIVQENEFLKKQIEAAVHYKNIAEGFVGLARMNGQEVPDLPK